MWRKYRLTFLFGLITLAGLFALFLYFRPASDPENAAIFGLSKTRLLVGAVFMVGLAVTGLITVASSLDRWLWWLKLKIILSRGLDNPQRIYWLLTGLYFGLLLILAFTFLAVSTAGSEIVLLRTILNRFGPLIGWSLLVFLLSGVLVLVSTSGTLKQESLGSSWKMVVWFILFLVVYVLSTEVYAKATYASGLKNFEPPVIFLGLYFLTWSWINWRYASRPWIGQANKMLLISAIFIANFVIYQQYAFWLNWRATPPKSYWNVLADAFLHGKLYLDNPPAIHDLTLFQGRWYVPNPPLAALVILPYILIDGVQKANTVFFSIFFNAVDNVLLFFLLQVMAKRGWIKLSRAGILWLVVFFGFGTVNLWVGINGMMWFLSQVLTVTFIALAALCAINSCSPWWIGICLGAAILSRPNVFVLWFFLLGIFLQVQQDEDHKITIQSLLRWMIPTVIPVCLAVAGLLYYNYIRFSSWLDFGYATINGAEEIVKNVQTYGMFNLHFVPFNLNVMFLYLPAIRATSPFIFPSNDGMSLFLAAPPLIYLFHKYEKKWWIIGAWTGVILSVALLSMYHNTGSRQFGWRYILDFIIPLFMLLAVSLGKKIPRLFSILVVFSILINTLGAVWFRFY